MKPRSIQTVARPTPQPGAGLLHPFPTRAIPHIDPFVFLDTAAPHNLGSGNIYVGPHPHRGVQPVSLVFRGRVEHRDSAGNTRTVHSGGMQWLVAGRGALHEETLNGDSAGVFHMAQLWVNVPAARKMDAPEHHAVGADDIPELTDLGELARLRLYAGTLGGETGPAPLPTPVILAHLILDPGGSISVPVPAGWNAAYTVVAGGVDIPDADPLGPGGTVVHRDDGEAMSLRSTRGGQVLIMAGKPIGEPIAMGGGFVMNTQAEIEQAFADSRAGRMGTLHPRAG